MRALSARFHLTEGQGGLGRLRPEAVTFYLAHRDVLLEIAAHNDRIVGRARQWEERHWIGEGCLQGYYRRSSSRGHSAETGTLKALLWGSAGRVLLTLKDTLPAGHPEGKFGGAWITLIFDESADHCRGGVQGYCATAEEALGLLDAAEYLPPMRPDKSVTVA